MEWLIIFSVWLTAALVYFSGPAYLREKGKNLATREDVGAITGAVEGVRLRYHEELEELKAALATESEGVIRRRDAYHRLTSGLRLFIQGHNKSLEKTESRAEEFHQAYAEAWLWAPDDLIRTVNTFVLLNQLAPAEDNARQRKLKGAYFEVLLGMRRDAGYPNTALGVEDLLFANF